MKCDFLSLYESTHMAKQKRSAKGITGKMVYRPAFGEGLLPKARECRESLLAGSYRSDRFYVAFILSHIESQPARIGTD